MVCSCVECFSGACAVKSCVGPSPMVARYIYGIIFLLTNLIAWMVRDYSNGAFGSLQNFKGCEGGNECLASEGVLRISLGCFIFFFLMYLTTVGTSKIGGNRDRWHSGWWPLKSLLWILLMLLPFFIPTSIIKLYGEVARFGAGIFLTIQLLSIINFIYWWNEKWLNIPRCSVAMVAVTVLSYAFTFTGLITMYIWFAPHSSCSLNIFFITFTALLILTMTLISLHPKVDAGLMTSSLVSLYIVFLCWSAIMSEPKAVICNTRPRQTGKGDTLTVMSFLLAVAAIVFATFSTGADSNPFTAPEIMEQEKSIVERNIPYSYGFFHFVFAMGSMYFAMLFVGWNLHQTMYKWSIDIGWASVWVKVVNEWLTAGVYIWTMVYVFILSTSQQHT